MGNKTADLSHEKKVLLKKELNHYQKSENHLKGTLINKAARSEREDWALENIAQDLGCVAQQDVRDINFPDYVSKILSDESLTELYEIFNEIIDINNRFVGYHNDEAKAILNGDPRVLDLLERIFIWVESYVESRVQRRNPRYGDCQPLKWQYIVQELEPFLNQYAFKKETLFNIFLPDWCRYILFYTFIKTWSDMIPIEANKHVVDLCFPIDLVREFPEIHQTVIDNHWKNLAKKIHFYTFFSEDMAVDESLYSQDFEGLLESLASMAEDISHMKPFLIYNNYRPEKTIIKLTETMSVAFDWSFENSIGSILVGKDETELIEAVRTHRFRYFFELGFDGIFKDKHLPFVTAESLSEQLGDRTLAVNHEILSRIHSKLYEHYVKIDTKKILDNLDPKASISDWSDVEVELVSTLVEEKYGDEPDAITSTKHARNLRKLRYNSLVRVLEALGCSVRQGPGSEKVIQREGEKNFTLGHHKRNHHVSVFKIREILKQLNIPAHQWLAASKS